MNGKVIDTKTITVRELRQALFNLDNQAMTVAELRKKLFEVDNQDAPVSMFDYGLWAHINGK